MAVRRPVQLRSVKRGEVPVPLLSTKLHIPPTRRELVPRHRLIERLNVGLGEGPGGYARKLTLISLPAGFGKTGSGQRLAATPAHVRASALIYLALPRRCGQRSRSLCGLTRGRTTEDRRWNQSGPGELLVAG